MSVTMQRQQIVPQDDEALTGVRSRFNSPIPSYDDGWGGLWVVRSSLGVDGVIRAQTWEDAWGIAEDCILPDADPEDPYFWEGVDRESGEFPEGVGYRPNGEPAADCCTDCRPLSCFLYAEDLNGQYLDPLTAEQVCEWGLSLILQPV